MIGRWVSCPGGAVDGRAAVPITGDSSHSSQVRTRGCFLPLLTYILTGPNNKSDWLVLKARCLAPELWGCISIMVGPSVLWRKELIIKPQHPRQLVKKKCLQVWKWLVLEVVFQWSCFLVKESLLFTRMWQSSSAKQGRVRQKATSSRKGLEEQILREGETRVIVYVLF